MKRAEELESLFKRNPEFLYWVVYEGSKGRGRRKGYVKSNVKDITEAFNDFLDFAENELSDGEYSICLRTQEKATKSELSECFVVGESHTKSQNSRDNSRESSGISGLGSINGLQFIAGLMNQQSPEVNRLRDENTRLQLELLEKKFEIKALEKDVEIAGASANETWGDIIKGIAKDYFPDILDRFAPEQAERAAHVQSLRGQKPVPRQTEPDTENEENEGNETEPEPTQPKPDRKEYAARLTAVLQETAKTFQVNDPVLVFEVFLNLLKTSEYAPLVKTMIQKEIKAAQNASRNV
jgi:hypothetical protein